MNLNNQISKVITKSKYLDQDAADSLQPLPLHAMKLINLQHKVPFLFNIKCCTKFLEYPMPGKYQYRINLKKIKCLQKHAIQITHCRDRSARVYQAESYFKEANS